MVNSSRQCPYRSLDLYVLEFLEGNLPVGHPMHLQKTTNKVTVAFLFVHAFPV